ncbi:MAG: hypothetical protein NTU98_08210 [Bacteroidetes bacterium]|nr:hypothetical protein [Bacteroidota bacterium]
MARLFVFGIGGTGARVLKSLVMLLASGLRPRDFEVIPILIDPHKDLKELNDCKILLKLYSDLNHRIYDKTTNVEQGFFRTTISTLKSLAVDSGLKDDFEFDERQDLPFGQFLELTELKDNDPTLDFVNLLFSIENLNKPLSVGFKGNPNVGSIVLNTLKDGAGFKAFESAFGNDDRIFIISSIFGGTGAAGFPLLLKNFRNHSKTIIKECQIGALTVTPYYKLSEAQKIKNEDANEDQLSSDVDSNNFMTKTKAALTYYIRDEFKNLYNALYYIGDPDKQNKPYENDEKNQPDKAHYIELLGALSVLDFANKDFTTTGDVFEYCLKKENVSTVDFTNIGDNTREIFGKMFVNLYILSTINDSTKNKPNLPFNKTNKFNDLYKKERGFFDNINSFFTAYYLPWLNELSNNERMFKPINISDKPYFNGLIKGYETERNILEGIVTKPFDISQIHLEIAKASRKKYILKIGEANPICQYFSLCWQGINEVVNSNINL